MWVATYFELLISVHFVTLSSTLFVTPISPLHALSGQWPSCFLCHVLVQRPAQTSHYKLQAPLQKKKKQKAIKLKNK